MTLDAFISAVVLGIVEGITEFLPVSSTGHLIVAASLLDFTDERGTAFLVSIQLGAILAVCWEFRERLKHVIATLFTEKNSQKLVANLLIAMMPAVIIGFMVKGFLERHLFAPVPVACALIAGALVIFIAEKHYKKNPQCIRIHSLDDIGWRDALKVGFAQCLAMIPGTSRSGATIIGALFFGFSRAAATEFSFFLAMPIMFAATAYALYDTPVSFQSEHWQLFGVGFVCAFIFAFLCVRWLLRYISHHDFTPFAWYRLAFGLFILVTSGSDFIQW